MTLTKAYIVSIGYATDAQRNTVQAAIKANANGWWHHLPDTWIVGGHDHTFWADLVEPLLAGTRARLLVLELPRDANARMFAVRGGLNSNARKWLWETYYGKPYPPAKSIPKSDLAEMRLNRSGAVRASARLLLNGRRDGAAEG